jgi:hypothetical protein
MDERELAIKTAGNVQKSLNLLKEGFLREGISDTAQDSNVLWSSIKHHYGDPDYAGMVLVNRASHVMKLAEISTKICISGANNSVRSADMVIQGENLADLGREALTTVSKIMNDIISVSDDLTSGDPEKVSSAKKEIENHQNMLKNFAKDTYKLNLIHKNTS